MRATTQRRGLLAAIALLPVLALSACGSDPAAPGTAKPAPAGSQVGISADEDVVSALTKVDSIAALVPEEVRKAGAVKVGGSVGSPPTAYYQDQANKKLVGIDIDFTDAVGRILGLTVQREEAKFETILPALDSGKYDFGVGNFGVTTARLKTIDFVTYIDDGQGFAVKKDNTTVQPVTDLGQLCGLVIGVGAGTTFESTLNSKKNICADTGRKPFEVKAFSDNGAVLTGLQQGRIDIVMSTINGLRYQAAQPGAGTKFLGEFHRLDVGFAFKKGSALTPAFQGAVNQLIKDGTYDRILKKWGVTDSAIKESLISPPEHP
ncbi:ABC transporter substrate-binding protein [Kitasatospora sp. NPDC057015]|uniref:ABC transporter substrate-binding protein n=1 Tax=Kitasatospora sp. NPDC057015 TaxID=3346001 RepID=UPI00362E07F4